MFFKTNKDPTKIVEGLNKLRNSKHCSTAAPKSDQTAATKSVGSKPQNTATTKPLSPSKSSHLPVRKGSNINRSFPRVSDADQKFDAKREANISRIAPALNSAPVSDDAKLGDSLKKNAEIYNPSSDKSNSQNAKDIIGANKTNIQAKDNPFENPSPDVWTSPPRASLCPQSSGVLEKLQEFSFRFSTSKTDTERHKVASDLRDRFNEQALSESTGVKNGMRTEITDNHTPDVYVGDRETPPPDGQANNGSKGGQNVQTSVISSKDGLSSLSDLGGRNISDLGARPKRYDSGFDSVSTSHFRDSSLSRQRDQLNSELKSALRSRSFMSTGSEVSGVDVRDEDSSNSVIAHSHAKTSSSAAGGHIGFVPGHHVPDGTEYSHQSDYSHMDHKGMSRDDLEGTADIGLADSRGFDAIRGTKSQISALELERMLRSQIQFERDKELRKERFIPSEGSEGDTSIQHGSQNAKSKPANLQPSQSLSPVPKSRSSTTRRTGFGDQGRDMNDEHKTAETQTAADRHESWTQTSVVLRESIGLQPDETLESHLENEGKYRSTLAQNQTENSETRGVNRETGKPHLLSKDSLLDTDFAQEYLKRDFSMEVMERIYSSSEKSHLTQHLSDTTVSHLNGRESIESRNNWTMLKPNETMETTYDDFSRVQSADLTRPSFYHRPPTACSTPFPGNRDMQTTLTPSSMHTLPSTGYQSMIASDRNTNMNKGKLADDKLF